MTQRRCEKTLQHLPATPHERLPLLHPPDHSISKIGRHRMYVRLHKHPNVILVSVFNLWKEEIFNSWETVHIYLELNLYFVLVFIFLKYDFVFNKCEKCCELKWLIFCIVK